MEANGYIYSQGAGMGIVARLRYNCRRLYLRCRPKSTTRKESLNSTTARRLRRRGIRPLLKCVVFLIVAASSGLGFFRECINLAKYVRMIRPSPRRRNWNDSPPVLDASELTVGWVVKLPRIPVMKQVSNIVGSRSADSSERAVNMFDSTTFAHVFNLSNIETI